MMNGVFANLRRSTKLFYRPVIVQNQSHGGPVQPRLRRCRVLQTSRPTPLAVPPIDLNKWFKSMDKLEELSSITRLSKNVVRVLGQNPGKFTLQGTNTYIIGSENPYILVDTGEGRQEYLSVLESALRDTATPINKSKPDISDIILSHWHHDHVGGVAEVLALLRRLWEERNSETPYTPPRLHKFPIPESPIDQSSASRSILPSILKSLPHDAYTPSANGSPIHDLHDSQILGTGLRVLHTPGHTVDSICLHIPQDNALYTADTVLGQGTAVFEDLSKYISSLTRMLRYGSDVADSNAIEGGYAHLYPGHGPVVPNGKDHISMYIKHRLEREDQIKTALAKSPIPDDSLESPDTTIHWTTWTLVKVIYASYPESLWLPAAHGIELHLKKLEKEGIVKRMGGEGVNTRWLLNASTSLNKE